MDNEYKKSADVGNGNWVLVIENVNVQKNSKPVLFGIYWGIPYEDPFGRQTCKIRTTEDVVLLNHEYTVISEKLQEYKNLGYELNSVANPEIQSKPLDMELIEKGRHLVEEEREIIWVFQLDGLSEKQACEEYFFSKYTDDSNYTICFLPNEKAKKELYNAFV